MSQYNTIKYICRVLRGVDHGHLVIVFAAIKFSSNMPFQSRVFARSPITRGRSVERVSVERSDGKIAILLHIGD